MEMLLSDPPREPGRLEISVSSPSKKYNFDRSVIFCFYCFGFSPFQ